jgi:hypothetical protein
MRPEAQSSMTLRPMPPLRHAPEPTLAREYTRQLEGNPPD